MTRIQSSAVAGARRGILAGKRFLCADNSPSMLRIYRALLQDMGATSIFFAENGAEAYDQFQRQKPDMVICEWTLPLVSGPQLIKLFRSKRNKHSPYVPVIVCAGEATLQTLTLARDIGANEFLAKPISANSLQDRIISTLANPRPFIESSVYFGPDRRRAKRDLHSGPERRGKPRTQPASGDPSASLRPMETQR